MPRRSPWETEHMAWKIVGSDFWTTTILKNRYTGISLYPSYFFIPKHYSGISDKAPAKSYDRQFRESTIESPFYGYDPSRIEM